MKLIAARALVLIIFKCLFGLNKRENVSRIEINLMIARKGARRTHQLYSQLLRGDMRFVLRL